MLVLQSLLGLVAFTALAVLLSEQRARIPWRTVAIGLGLQLALALLLLKLPPAREALGALNGVVLALQGATQEGASFVFGYLGGGPQPFDVTRPGTSFILAFQALPLILVMSALSSLLFFWRVLPRVIRGMAWLLQRTLGVGGALGMGVAANIFIGMIEAPLLVRPYLRDLSRGELFVLMTAGMATIAGNVLVLYASFLAGVIPDALGHILVASVISAPAAITLALIMVPDRGDGTAGDRMPEQTASGAMDAVTQWTLAGVQLLLNIAAMLLVFVALVSIANALLGLLPALGGAPLSVERMLGWLMAPIVWLMGIPWAEAATAGSLMGIKTILNELIAYLALADLPEDALSERSRLIMTYALCGFANLGSLGIMIGGLGGMAPERRDEIVGLGLKAVVAGTLATCMTGAVVGVVA